MAHDIAKGLEIWGLQSLLDVSILLGFLALGIALVDGYLKRVGRHLTLRVSTEIWQVLPIVLVDLLLAIVVLVGLFVVNPDIMADVKMAVPFYPLAVVLITGALTWRVFGGAHEAGTKAHRGAIWLLFLANVVNLVGFVFVAEAPSSEYLALHPSTLWTWVKTHLKSNASPDGLELAYWSFWIFFPILILILLWAFSSAMRWMDSGKGPAMKDAAKDEA